MKTILILGGHGFIGTNITAHIDAHLSDIYRVIIFDKYDKHPEGHEFRCVEKTYAGDFADTRALDRIFSKHKIDLVVHAISTTLPALSFSARYDIESNLVPSVELLNMLVKYKVEDIVYLSSGGAVYGNRPGKHKESDNLFPISSYGVVKMAIEKYLFQYAELYDLKPLVLRLSNPYGKYHYSTRQGVINIAAKAAVEGNPFKVWGDGDAKKDYFFIEDFCDILFKLLEKNVRNEILNICSGETSSVNEILSGIKQHVPDFSWDYSNASRFDVLSFELDNRKLISMIGEFDFTPLYKGLSNTLKWLEERG